MPLKTHNEPAMKGGASIAPINPAGTNRPAGFRDLARRMTSRTTDLIAIGIVLVASLTLGRQVHEWWHAAPPAAGVASPAGGRQPGWEDDLQPVALEFGDLPLAMTRQVVLGEREAAIAALVRHCAAAAKACLGPWRAPDATEEQLLAKTSGLTPADQEAEVWQVYTIDERFPLVAAVRRFAASEAPRLVCWGLAMSAGNKAWNLYVFHGARAAQPASSGLHDVPLPPHARRNLSLRDERGGAFIGFSGDGTPQAWVKFYDDWFATAGWSSGTGWLDGAEAWSARFHKPDAPEAGRVEIQFAVGGRRELTGLLQIFPQDSSR